MKHFCDPKDEAMARFLHKNASFRRGSDTLIFIPVRNEEHTIATVIDKARRATGFDILVVDDQSTDTTPEILSRLDVSVLTRRTNAGSRIVNGLEAGYALGYSYVVKMDGDDQHDAQDVLRLHRHAKKTGADIVIGSRHIHRFSGNIRSISGAGMLFCAGVASICHRKRITDATSGLKIWNRKACEVAITAFRKGKLKQGSTYHTEELIIAARRKLKVEEIDVIMRSREYGETKSYSSRNMFLFPINIVRSTLRALF